VGVVPGSYAELRVTDTGTGIDRETQSHVFEPFFTTKEAGSGTGLGLSTVDGIVRQSGGHIWLYSEEGLGTTFKIYFPRLDAAGHGATTLPAEGAQRQGNETVLVVEDEDGVRLLTRRLLERAGYTVRDADSPAAAATYLADHAAEVDVLLSDVVMPGGFGSDVARDLLERNPAARVVFMSGYADATIRQRSSLDPGAQLLHKPFTRSTLLWAIEDALATSTRRSDGVTRD